MKKFAALFFVILFAFTMCSCSGGDNEQPEETPPAAGEQMRLCIVDGAGSNTLVLAGENAGDVYTVSVNEMTVFVDDVAAEPDALENGMYVTVDGDYELLETWPAQFAGVTLHAYSLGSAKNPGGLGYDICGLYLQVLEDLWNADSGLNENVNTVSVDLSTAPGDMTDGEKAAVAWIFGSKHNVQALNFTMDELADNGYLTDNTEMGQSSERPNVYYWKNGLLFTITPNENEPGDPKKDIRFDAMKWCSPIGAIFFNDCKARWGKSGKWENYEQGSFAIA